jgi:predicted RecB family nuclease
VEAPSAGAALTAAPPRVEFELFAPAVVGALPLPDPGDIFFDFEGDPLWAEPDSTVWGLEYLFGVVEAPVTPGEVVAFRPFWAHDRAQEKQALVDFLDYVGARRAVHPDLHVYHYAPYEKSALQRLAGRHGVGEAAVDDLLKRGVLVDLYATVRASLRTGQRSYSIKKLEPLYMDTARDEGGVTTAGDSIVEYADACALRDAGDLVGWEKRLEQIAVYNEYDCVSTLRLRDWLLARAAEQGVTPHAAVAPDGSDDAVDDGPADGDPLVDELLAFADDRAIGAPGA